MIIFEVMTDILRHIVSPIPRIGLGRVKHPDLKFRHFAYIKKREIYIFPESSTYLLLSDKYKTGTFLRVAHGECFFTFHLLMLDTLGTFS